MPYSYHSHSGQFCKHGYGLLEDVVKEAIRKGFKVYGLSEHMPRYSESEIYPEELEANCTIASLATTYNEFKIEAKRLQKAYKESITLLIGTEIEFINKDYADHVQKLKSNVEYVVGSLHHIRSIPLDYSTEVYNTILKGANDNFSDLFVEYFDEQFLMLQAVQPEVVGHFDLVKIFAENSVIERTLRDPVVLDRVCRNIEHIVAYGGLFEINSRAWKKGLKDAYPQKSIIELIKQKGGRFTICDDCHGPQDVGMFYEKLPAYFSETGIDTIYYLDKQDGKLVVKEHKNILKDEFWSKIQKNW